MTINITTMKIISNILLVLIVGKMIIARVFNSVGLNLINVTPLETPLLFLFGTMYVTCVLLEKSDVAKLFMPKLETEEKENKNKS